MNAHPQRNLVLVELEEAPPSSGLIQLARLDKPPSMFARVKAIGPDVIDVRVGKRVVVSRLQGIEVGDAGVLLPEDAILAYAGNDDHDEVLEHPDSEYDDGNRSND